MSGKKRPIDNDQATMLKAKRKSISLDTKMRIILRVEAGEKKAHVARSVGLSESTLRSIVSQADRVKASVQSTSSIAATKTTRSRSCLIEKMEKMLSLWLSDMTENRVPIKQSHIMEKALCIFNFLKSQEQGDCKETFLASRGWFEKFKKRSKIQSIRLTGKVPDSFAKEAGEFRDVFQAIEAQGPPSLVCGTEDSGMFCKKLPARTYISPSSDTPGDEPQDSPIKSEESEGDVDRIQQNENFADEQIRHLLNAHMLSVANRNEQDVNSANRQTISRDESLTTDFLLETLDKVAEILNDISKNDPNTERSDGVRKSVLHAFTCYQNILDQRRKRTLNRKGVER